MATKKSELYSSIGAMCDELLCGLDASQYKDYVLIMPFIKYIRLPMVKEHTHITTILFDN